MAAVWTRLLLLGLVVAVAHGLTCRRCPIVILGRCLSPSDDVQCNSTTSSCITATTAFNGTSSAFRLQSRGCAPNSHCDQTVAGTFFEIGFTASIRCCRTDLCNGGTSVQLDLCNGGTSVQLSLAAACAAVLASLWAR
ncbi:unnamed protein product [Boreogadus saida]